MITENKMNALNKMLVEMNKAHSTAEDSIHNWLCKQEDESLMIGILKEDRTIKGALEYCTNKASKLQKSNVAVVDDETVFNWVKEYFNLEFLPIEFKFPTVKKKNPETKKSKPTISKPKEVKSKSKGKVSDFTPMKGEQLSLLDML